MKLFKVRSGILIENQGNYYQKKGLDWDLFFNDNRLLDKMMDLVNVSKSIPEGPEIIQDELEAPVQNQEIWASGVTYYNSKLGRQEEAKDAGGGDFYARVYLADRPELFFKATAHRTVGHGGKVNIRTDSYWDVPEPELALAITSKGKIIGYTIGNDMSSRSIEGENPLYLPQAKTYDGCAALGPCIYVTNEYLDPETEIYMEVLRNDRQIFEGRVRINQMKRKAEELVSFLFRASSFPYGCFLMTGTGIVPSREFTLKSGDEIKITINPIGTLINQVR
jgi:2-dehydro-3-deoxy-D-arabinonate dehydratase